MRDHMIFVISKFSLNTFSYLEHLSCIDILNVLYTVGPSLLLSPCKGVLARDHNAQFTKP